MWAETFLRIKRDKRKWLFFLGGYLSFMIVYAGTSWLVGLATHKLTPTIGIDNAYALLMGFIRCFGVIPFIFLGLFVYWADEIKPEKKNIRPWLFWSILLVGSTVIGYIGNDVIGQRIIREAIETHSLAQAASWRSGIYVATGLSRTAAFFLLFPCMLSVWEKKNVWEGYKSALFHWKKDLGWLGLMTGLSALSIGCFLAMRKLSVPGVIAQCVNLVLSLYGNGIIIYFLSVWVAKSPYQKKAATEKTQVPQGTFSVVDMERIQVFFEAVIQQQNTVVRQMIQETPVLVHAVSSVKGNTALHLAAWNGWSDLAKLILDTDESTRTVQNEEGETPFDLATKQGFDELAQLLK